MEETIISLTINKWMLYVIVVALFASFISNMMGLYANYLKKKVARAKSQNESSGLHLQNVTRSALEFKITEIAFTVENDHGIIKAELPYQYSKMKHWKAGDKIMIEHYG